jgi:hypothetical protein
VVTRFHNCNRRISRSEIIRLVPIRFDLAVVGHHENQRLVESLAPKGGPWANNPSSSPKDLENPYTSLRVGLSVCDLLWKDIPAEVPEAKRWVIYGCPVLVNPDSNVIFAFGVGLRHALRLPEPAFRQGVEQGANLVIRMHGFSIDLGKIGTGWLQPHKYDNRHLWISAYQYADHP